MFVKTLDTPIRPVAVVQVQLDGQAVGYDFETGALRFYAYGLDDEGNRVKGHAGTVDLSAVSVSLTAGQRTALGLPATGAIPLRDVLARAALYDVPRAGTISEV